MICAEILQYRGAPAIFINGKYATPTMFFGRLNPEFFDERRGPVYHSEIVRAAKSGVHIHTMFLYMDIDLECADEDSNAENRKLLREILEIDPEGYLIPRCLVPYDHTLVGIPDSENERFTDGKLYEGESFTRSDFVSPVWRERALKYLTRFIRSILADPVLCERVIGYHFSGGETGEWFQRRYWDGVLNISDANSRQFRLWLKKKYGTNDALSEAWGEAVSLDDVTVPADLPGVSRKSFITDVFFESKGERKYVDYLDYFSDEITDLIEDAAELVKRETDGNSLFVSFYGYHFEIPGAHSGHNSLSKLLKCPYVDILTSPVSYEDRNECGMGAYMTSVSSVLSAGKMWLDESDYRMPVVRVPKKDSTPGVKDMDSAHEVILREYGKLALNGAGTWWMDLFNIGWYDDDRIWKYISEGRKYYDMMRAAAKPKMADICYLVDEKAMSLVGNTWQFADSLLKKTRNEAYFTGLSFDMRLIEDFIDGKADGAKVYVFLNPFRLEERDMENIALKLRENKATALWMFGFTKGSDKAALKALTGFELEITDDAPEQFEFNGKIIPRVAVSPLTVPKNGEALATYENGNTAFARTAAAGYQSYFCSGTCVTPDILRTVAEAAGARLYLDAGDCFNCIGNLAYLHTVTEGEKRINFDTQVTELCSGKIFEPGSCVLNANAGQTFLFIRD